MSFEEAYELEKAVWTEDDFSAMGWHDARIYGFAILNEEEEMWKNEFLLDIDYIFKWVQPFPPSSHFTFWVAPCTLIFRNFYDLVIDADAGGESLEVADLRLSEKLTNQNNGVIYYSWEIELQGGLISLKSEGFNQIVRGVPIHTPGQTLSIVERGGISFERAACRLQG